MHPEQGFCAVEIQCTSFTTVTLTLGKQTFSQTLTPLSTFQRVTWFLNEPFLWTEIATVTCTPDCELRLIPASCAELYYADEDDSYTLLKITAEHTLILLYQDVYATCFTVPPGIPPHRFMSARRALRHDALFSIEIWHLCSPTISVIRDAVSARDRELLCQQTDGLVIPIETHVPFGGAVRYSWCEVPLHTLPTSLLNLLGVLSKSKHIIYTCVKHYITPADLEERALDGFVTQQRPDYSFVLFLNDDFSGGEIVFPHLSVSIPPTAGTLVVWSNTYLHEVDEKSLYKIRRCHGNIKKVLYGQISCSAISNHTSF